MSGLYSNYESNVEALQSSQEAARIVQGKSPSGGSLVSKVFSGESNQQWEDYERYLVSCLRSGDDKSATECLQRIVDRFGSTNERVMALKGIFQEAVARDSAALEKLLNDYQTVIGEGHSNLPVAKRRAALLKSISSPELAVKELVAILDTSPTDVESWVELSDLYVSLGMLPQAAFCLEEAVLIVPNAWNVQARLGEVTYLLSLQRSGLEKVETLQDAIRRFCRSIELCENYLRGYYGLHVVTSRLLEAPEQEQKLLSNKNPTFLQTAKLLNEDATKKISKIISSPDAAADNPEVIAGKALLDAGA